MENRQEHVTDLFYKTSIADKYQRIKNVSRRRKFESWSKKQTNVQLQQPNNYFRSYPFPDLSIRV